MEMPAAPGHGPEGRIASAELFVVLSDVWFWRGGLTRNALHKATLISDALGTPVTVLTTDFDPDTDVSVERMRAAGLIGELVRVRNLFEDAGLYGSPPTPFFTGGSGFGRPVAFEPDEDEAGVSHAERTDPAGRRVRVTMDVLGRVVRRESFDFDGRLRGIDRFDPATGRMNERDFFDPAERLRAGCRREPDEERWRITLLDGEGAAVREFDGLTAMRSAWLESFAAGHADSIFQVESENHLIVKAVLDMDAPGVAKVMMMHSSHLDYPHTLGSPTMPEHRPVLKRLDEFDAFVLITPTHRDDIALEFGPRETLHAVPHDAPVPHSGAGGVSDPNLAVGVGRFAARKNWDHVIRAFAAVAKRVPNARFELWGYGPLQDEYEALIGELGVTGRFRIMGPTDDPDSVFRRAGFSVLAGIREGFSLVLLESLSCGTPVVVYDGKYGPHDMVRDGVDGTLVPYGDIDALAGAMADLYAHPERQERMGAAAPEINGRFSAEKCVERWLRVYDAALVQRDRRVTLPRMSCVATGLSCSHGHCRLDGRIDADGIAGDPVVRLYARPRDTIAGSRYFEAGTLSRDGGRIDFSVVFDPGPIVTDGRIWDLYASVTLRNAHRFVRIGASDGLFAGDVGPASVVLTSKRNVSLRRAVRDRRYRRALRRRAGAVRRRAGAAKRRVMRRVRRGIERVTLVCDEALTYARSRAVRQRARYARAFTGTPLDPGLIVVETVLDDAARGNVRALVLRMLTDPRYDGYTFEWVIRDDRRVSELNREVGGRRLRFIPWNSAEHARALARAGHVFTNGSLPAFFQRRPGQVVLNTWHGVPIKKMGYAIPDGRTEARNVARVLMHCDYLVSGSRYEAEKLYLDSYRLDGIYPGTILYAGHPRMDLTIAAHRGEQIERLQTAGVDVDAGRTIVLYAPTWRGDSAAAPSDTVGPMVRFTRELQASLGDRYRVLLRFHSLTARHVEAHGELRGLLVPADIDTNELLAACDVLVTDYSSVFVDFMITARPIVFYLDDVAGYIAERGVYLQPDELPGPLVSTAAEVARHVESAEEERARYAGRYEELRRLLLPMEDGAATERVLSAVFDDDGSVLSRTDFTTGATRLLLHAGSLRGGRRARSLVALARRLDPRRCDVSVLAPYSADAAQRRTLDLLPMHVRTFLRLRANYTFSERVRLARWLKKPSRESREGRVPVELLKRTWSHVFGSCRFDVAVDLAGSSALHAGLFGCGETGRVATVGHSAVVRACRAAVGAPFGGADEVGLPDAPYVRMVDPEVVSAEAAACVVHEGDGRRVLAVEADDGGETEIELSDPEVTFVVACRGFAHQSLILRAFERVVESHPHAHLLFLNPGRGRDRLAASVAASSAGWRARIIDVGNELAVIARCGCLIAPGFDHEASVTALEAVVLGLAVLVGDSPGSRAAFPGSDRLVAWDERTVAEAMRVFLSGSLVQMPFDCEAYNERAIAAFYRLLGWTAENGAVSEPGEARP